MKRANMPKNKMTEQKTEKKKTGIKPLMPKTKGPYDGLINEVRQTLQVPFNRTILADISQAAYVKSCMVNGRVDVKKLAAPYAVVKVKKDVDRLEKELAAKKAAMDAMEGKK